MTLIVVMYAAAVGWITAHGGCPWWVTVLLGASLGFVAAHLETRHQRRLILAASQTLDRIIAALEASLSDSERNLCK